MKWKTSTLADISELIQTGKTPPTEIAKYFGGEVNWFTPGDLDNSKELTESVRKISAYALEDKKAVLYPYDVVLISCIGDIGKLGIARDRVSSNQQITAIKPKAELSVDYLYYWLRANKKALEQQGNSAVVPIINNASLKKIKIVYPPLEEQRRIAAVLDKADRLRQLDCQLIAKYDQLTQSVFLDMFGDPMKNGKGWTTVILEKITAFLTSGSRGWAAYYSTTGSVFLRIQNVGKNKLKLEDTTFVNPPNTAEALRTKVKPGDVLLSITADLGRTAVVPENMKDAYINQHLAIIRLKEGFNPYYISAYLTSDGGISQIIKANKGGVKAGLNFNDIKSLKILNPPIELQNCFAEIVFNIESQKAKAEASLQKSEALFNALLQRAFRGELFAERAESEETATGPVTAGAAQLNLF